MAKLHFIVAIIVCFLGSSFGECQTRQPAYNEIMEHEIDLISHKIMLKASKSPRLSAYGETCEKKLTFVVMNWDRLVFEMMERNINAKPYAVHQYLNEAYKRDLPQNK